jgi:hypothetical protein
VWHWPRWASYVDGGMTDPIRIGGTAAMADEMSDGAKADAWGDVNNVLLIALEGLGAMAALGFFVLRRGER